MHETHIFVLCLDDYPRPADPAGGGLSNVRLLDGTTLREVGASGVGAWQGYGPAIEAAVKDAIGKGGL